MDELELYYDHYKRTFDAQLLYLDKRNKYFLATLILMSLLLFNSMYGVDFVKYLELYMTKKNQDNTLNVGILNSILLFAILWTCLLYFKTINTVDRGYDYLHSIEKNLTQQLSKFRVTREGRFYRENQTTFSKSVAFIYKYVFPISILVVCICSSALSIVGKSNIAVTFEILLNLLILYVVMSFLLKKKVSKS